MCPATIAIAATAIAATGAITGGIAQANAAHYQAQVSNNNSTIAQNNARYAASATATNTENAALKARARQSSVRAGLAANNVDVNSGSAADTQVSQRKVGALDVATLAGNDALQVYGYESQATGYKAQSKLDESQVGPDIAGGIFKAAGIAGGNASLLSGAPSVPEEYQWMQSPGSAGELPGDVG